MKNVKRVTSSNLYSLTLDRKSSQPLNPILDVYLNKKHLFNLYLIYVLSRPGGTGNASDPYWLSVDAK